MADTSEILSDSFDNNISSEVDTRSVCLSAVETKASLVLTSRTTPTSILTSSIHNCRSSPRNALRGNDIPETALVRGSASIRSTSPHLATLAHTLLNTPKHSSTVNCGHARMC